jgi:hypothetical protein
MAMAALITPAVSISLPRRMPLANMTAANELTIITIALLERVKVLAIEQNTAIAKNR